MIAIDPGPLESAYVWTDESGRIIRAAKVPNAELLRLLEIGAEIGPSLLDGLRSDARAFHETPIAIEMIASQGMAVGQEVFETCVWVGIFIHATGRGLAGVTRVKRHEVKMHLCHHPRANDSNIRQAIIDRYGGKDAAIGKKAKPGPLYGISGDQWQALAVALVVLDRQKTEAAA